MSRILQSNTISSFENIKNFFEQLSTSPTQLDGHLQQRQQQCSQQNVHLPQQSAPHQKPQSRRSISQNSKLSSVITQEQRLMVRLVILVDQIARPVLLEIFRHGTKDKASTETLKEYFVRRKLLSNSLYHKLFNKSSQQKINSDPSCQSFDVTVLYLAIRFGCCNLAPPNDDDVWVCSSDTLENHLKRIKDFRNTIMHSEFSISSSDFYKKLEEIRQIFVRSLELAKERYSIDATIIDKIIINLHSEINCLRDSPLEDQDLTSYENIALFNALTNILENKGSTELEKLFEMLSNVSPAALIARLDIQLNVNLIYTSLKIVRGGRNDSGRVFGEEEEEIIDYTTFLQRARIARKRAGKPVQIILVEGIAGAGKSTFIKKILSDWVSGRKTGNYSITDLHYYKIIIPIECRSHSYKSLTDILCAVMPLTRKIFREELHMRQCLLELQTLYIIDGLDEFNSESKKVLQEVLEIQSENATIICTSRPEKVKEFYKMLPSHINVMHLHITGVPIESREVFVEKYYEQLSVLGITNQGVEGLITYLRTTGTRLQDHWSLPLNLSLVALLWAVSPDRVSNVTDSIELMAVIHELVLDKLLERLTSSINYLEESILKKSIDEFLSLLSKEALSGIHESTLLIPNKAMKELTEFCINSGLPPKELLGAFLVQKNSWSSTSLVSQVMFPHSTGQEYFAAKYLHQEVFERKPLDTEIMVKSALDLLKSQGASNATLQNVAKAIYETESCHKTLKKAISIPLTLDFYSPSMERYQNVLVMVMVFLNQSKMDINYETAEDLVELLSDCGVNCQGEWIRILNKVRCNYNISKAISQIPNVLKDISYINDSVVFAYNTLFRNIKPERVNIDIHGEPFDIPHLIELLRKISEEEAFVEKLYFSELIKLEEPITESPLIDGINQIMNRCLVKRYRGPMPSTLSNSEIDWLQVSLPNDATASRCMDHLQARCELIRGLSLVVFRTVSVDVLQPLPDVHNKVNLFLPNIGKGDVEYSALLAKKLQPLTGKKSFFRGYFPRCNLTPPEIEYFIEELGRHEVRVSHQVFFPTKCRPDSKDNAKQLHGKLRKTLFCNCGIVWGHEGPYKGTPYDLETW